MTIAFSALTLFGVRKSIRPAKIEWWGVGVVICPVPDYLYIVQLMPPPIHPKTLSSLASFKSRLVLPFWYRLTQVVLEKRPSKGHSSLPDEKTTIKRTRSYSWMDCRCWRSSGATWRTAMRMRRTCLSPLARSYGAARLDARGDDVSCKQSQKLTQYDWLKVPCPKWLKFLSLRCKLKDRLPSKELREWLGIDDIALVLQQNRPRWYGQVPRKKDDDWVKKCMEYEVEGPRPRARPKRTWREVVREDCQARKTPVEMTSAVNSHRSSHNMTD